VTGRREVIVCLTRVSAWRGGMAARRGGLVGSRIRTVRLRSEGRNLRGLVCVGINEPIQP
jgi:hypothetical protein